MDCVLPETRGSYDTNETKADMSQATEDFPSRVSAAVYAAYQKLPKKGKPQLKKEWTLLAGVVMVKGTDNFQSLTINGNGDAMQVVALGTGSKCLGRSQVGLKGDKVRDSHAEVMARRSFLCYLYNELEKAYTGGESDVFTVPSQSTDWKCSLRPKVTFHLFTSHTPCGDASIIPRPRQECRDDTSNNLSGGAISPWGDSISNCVSMSGAKKMKTDSSSHDEQDGVESNHVTSVAGIIGVGGRRCRNDETGKDGDEEKIEYADFKPTVYNLCRKRKVSPQPECRIVQDDEVGEVCPVMVARDEGCDLRACMSSIRGTPTPEQSHSDTHPPPLPLTDDVYRTGAKCVPSERADPRSDGSGYHTTGVLRTKPGRGERTDSMSCSDKIARWCIVGCQGALLSFFTTHPVYWQSVIVGRCPYSQMAMERAVHSRVAILEGRLPPPYHLSHPLLLQTGRHEFESSREVVQRLAGPVVSQVIQDSKVEMRKDQQHKIVPSPAAIAWYRTDQQEVTTGHDVVVNGKRQGMVKSDLDKPKARSVVCSLSLFHRFHRLVSAIDAGNLPSPLRCDNLSELTYDDMKRLAMTHQHAWSTALEECLPCWVRKSSAASQFTIDHS